MTLIPVTISWPNFLMQHNSNMSTETSDFLKFLEVLHGIVILLHYFPMLYSDGEQLTSLLFVLRSLAAESAELHGNGRRPISSQSYERIGLDVPSLHRLLKLVVRSIPLYGHCLNFYDLLFEIKSQTFKRNYQINYSANSHAWAFKTDIANY